MLSLLRSSGLNNKVIKRSYKSVGELIQRFNGVIKALVSIFLIGHIDVLVFFSNFYGCCHILEMMGGKGSFIRRRDFLGQGLLS